MWEASPDADQKCAVRSYLLTALAIDGMSKKSDKSCYPVRKAPPQGVNYVSKI